MTLANCFKYSFLGKQFPEGVLTGGWRMRLVSNFVVSPSHSALQMTSSAAKCPALLGTPPYSSSQISASSALPAAGRNGGQKLAMQVRYTTLQKNSQFLSWLKSRRSLGILATSCSPEARDSRSVWGLWWLTWFRSDFRVTTSEGDLVRGVIKAYQGKAPSDLAWVET